jgi:4'-phosphopantetheinyl transferase
MSLPVPVQTFRLVTWQRMSTTSYLARPRRFFNHMLQSSVGLKMLACRYDANSSHFGVELLWSRLGLLLDDVERGRAARFAFERHRREYVAAHASKRLMLTVVSGAAAHSWAFETAPSGKPRVGPLPGPHFNLSHSERLVACAVSKEVELGIDVEPINRRAPLEIAKTHFAPMEQSWIAALPRSEQALGFWRVWTLKEAFIKATGRGLAQPLQHFSFMLDPLGVIFHDRALGDSQAWHFEQRLVGSGHLLALAWRDAHHEASVDIREMQLEMLLAETRI